MVAHPGFVRVHDDNPIGCAVAQFKEDLKSEAEIEV
jgi:hypothetical protein